MSTSADDRRSARCGLRAPRLGFPALFGAAVFLACAGLVLGRGRLRAAQAPVAHARVAVWTTDRDANLVYGLDASLLAVRAVPLRAPLEVEARADGGAWVVSALHGDPLGPHQLARLAPDGAVVARAPLEPALDLAVDELDRALVVELAPAGERVGLFDAAGASAWSRAWAGARCAAARGRRVLVGTATGELALFDASQPGAPPALASFGTSVADVAPGPAAAPGGGSGGGETWWVLDAGAGGRLALLDAQLSVLWSRAVLLHALHLAPCDGEERVWVADATAPHARRIGPQGALEIDRPDMALGGLDRAAVRRDGTALFTAPGALLALDAAGQNAPGQAGFDFLVDVAVVR